MKIQNEAYIPAWVGKATYEHEELSDLIDSLSKLDLLAQGIYEAVLKSPERYKPKNILNLELQIETITHTLDTLKTAWESDSMAN